MKKFFAVALIVMVCAVSLGAISDVNRARTIIDLLKDGTVSNETPYGSLDLASSATATKYATAFWEVYGPDRDGNGVPISNPTNGQLASFMLKRIGRHCRDVLELSRVPNVAATEMSAVA